MGNNIYHIGGIKNSFDPLVEIHNINLRNTDKDINDHEPQQKKCYVNNNYIIDENNSIYCNAGQDLYIFPKNLFPDEYLKYSLIDNKWNIFRFPENTGPKFCIDSRLVVSVDKQIYFFLFESSKGQIRFKLLTMY